MKLVNTEPFGNFVPGDEVEVPDGAVYDPMHWAEVNEAKPADDKKKGDK